jgi:hypothetical protein
MNLFRSGESAGAELFTLRLDTDFVAKSEAYANAALAALGQALS